MGESEKEGTQTVKMSWPEWHAQQSKALAFDLGQIAVAGKDYDE
jgi:hypothetical protein